MRKNADMRIRLREHRSRLGISLEEMADRAGFSYSQLSRWERGDGNIPSNTLPVLATAYSCRLNDIFADDDEPEEDAVVTEIRETSFALDKVRREMALRLIKTLAADQKADVSNDIL